MSRKHYEAIARTLREGAIHLAYDESFDYQTATPWTQGAYDQWSTTVLAIARTLHELSPYNINGNKSFDTERFLSACGFQGGVR